MNIDLYLNVSGTSIIYQCKRLLIQEDMNIGDVLIGTTNVIETLQSTTLNILLIRYYLKF